tara:strand:- start:288 stop:482 length:195 start_codon:yes stop_codon:yes gene_type:complete
VQQRRTTRSEQSHKIIYTFEENPDRRADGKGGETSFFFFFSFSFFFFFFFFFFPRRFRSSSPSL